MPASADAPFKFVPASACDDPTTFQVDWGIYTHDADAQTFDLVGSEKALRRDISTAKAGCTTADERAFANAYFYAWKAALDHRSDAPWQTEMNLGLQLLEKCVARHYGTKIGAQCQTDLETNIHRKLAWSTP